MLQSPLVAKPRNSVSKLLAPGLPDDSGRKRPKFSTKGPNSKLFTRNIIPTGEEAECTEAHSLSLSELSLVLVCRD